MHTMMQEKACQTILFSFTADFTVKKFETWHYQSSSVSKYKKIVYQQMKQVESDDVHFHRGIKKENLWSVMRIFLLFCSWLSATPFHIPHTHTWLKVKSEQYTWNEQSFTYAWFKAHCAFKIEKIVIIEGIVA